MTAIPAKAMPFFETFEKMVNRSGLINAEIARRAYMDRANIGKILNKRHVPDKNTLMRIVSVLREPAELGEEEIKTILALRIVAKSVWSERTTEGEIPVVPVVPSRIEA